ncbi:MAG TPA: biopolymer transporter ExbD [Pirellulales bacterium]|nr:biopolymer transporter ExbD [Pirellulales bacterium]
MTVRFNCAQCGKRLKAPTDYAGRQVQCTGCGAVQTVPPPDEIVPEALHAATATAHAGEDPPRIESAAGEGEEFTLSRKSEVSQDDGLDMTPMVDVTFLLLIFFMVTAAFALQKSIHIPTPDPTDSATQSRTIEEIEQDDDNIIVRIDKDSSIWVNDSEAMSEQDLLAKLKDARSGGSDADSSGPSKMMVLASGEARHEKVVMALDAGTAAGIDDVRLATGDEEDF